MKILFALIAAVSTVGLTVPAVAQTSTRVSFADLDTSSDAGRHAFELRVRTAARNVCSGASSDLGGATAAAKCRRVAIANAMTQFENKTAPRYASR